MKKATTLRLAFTTSVLALAVAACTQGSDISSPGASNPGTPPDGGGGGGGDGGDGGGTVSCPSGFTQGAAVGGLTTCSLSGVILSDLTLENVNGVAYRIEGRVDVGEDIGADGSAGGTSASLTIEPGVTIFGASGADYLVVNRGSRLLADGQASAPIVFTSANDLERQADSDPSNDDGGSNISEWGGLVLLGRAPINNCLSPTATTGTDACENIIEGVTSPEAVYGGGRANDDSGIMRYMQVRFAGFAINTQGNELNGITLGGIGNGTTFEYIQVHNNSDDGVEYFGGTVNTRYLVLTGNDDDSIDTDNGFSGNIQYALVVQREDGGDNIVEASSAGGTALPRSNATISNFTFIGNRSNAFRLNTNTIGRYVNGIVDYGAECFRFESSAGDGAAGYGGIDVDPSFDSVLFDCDGGLARSGSDEATAAAAVAGGSNNTTGVSSSLAGTYFPGPAENGVTPFNAATLDGFFDTTNYIGAFGPTETQDANWASGWTFALFSDPACPSGTSDSGLDLDGQNVCRISGVQTSSVRLTRGNVYELDGRVDVGVDIGADGNAADGSAATLTIESGVTVFGDSGEDYLVVNRGSQIFSNGTAADPVVFTSEDDLTNSQIDPANAIGEWGGLVLLGRAPINNCLSPTAASGTVDCENIIEGVTSPEAVYGGGVANDNSGSMTFTQVKYAGFAINTQGNELNGITFGGIGNGTTVEHVQVHNNSDDGVEFFGGNVNVRYLVLTGNDDDSIDTDNGYNGNIQYAIVVQREDGGDNIVEASSAGGTATPRSNATIANFTFVGNRSNALRLNTNTIGRYVNGVVDYGKECFRWEDSAGDGVAGYGGVGVDPSFDSVLFDCDGGLARSGGDTAAAQGAVTGGSNNTTSVASTLSSTFVNGSAEAAATPFDATTLNAFFETAPYIGAVENAQDTWWQGWSCGLEASDPC
ncbi:hypothetical protein [Henriciella marina]|uniref:hypothetical protein n=1 Tax=Henriciella marina TaxID=453851 RepID=UPI000368C295|nr:hypothetical protein [Henriciella marina]